MPDRRQRILPAVFVENTPTVACDADGVLLTNTLGDQIHSWRMSRHRALNVAALIVAAVSKWEREEAAADKIATFPEPKRLPPAAH